MEILAPERYEELEEFVAHHPRGEFTQSPRWRLVKENWDYAAVVSGTQTDTSRVRWEC